MVASSETELVSDAVVLAVLTPERLLPVVVTVMLSVAVASWVWSPIKSQADMGVLLAFMFLLNMVGALVLLPSIGDVEIDHAGPFERGDAPYC